MNIESGTTYSEMSTHLCFSKCGNNLFPFSNLIVCVSVVVWGGGLRGVALSCLIFRLFHANVLLVSYLY